MWVSNTAVRFSGKISGPRKKTDYVDIWESSLNIISEYLSEYIFPFLAAPVAYGSSQVRSRIRAAAVSLCHNQTHRIRATSMTYTTAHGNAGS